MNHLSKWLIALCCASLCSVAMAAKDPNKNAIKARQGEMQMRSFNAGPPLPWPKAISYDAAMASKLAGNLKMLLDIDMSRAWPKGSDLDNYFGETTSKPEIWTTYPEIVEYGKRYAKAVNELSSVAGNGRMPCAPRSARLVSPARVATTSSAKTVMQQQQSGIR